MRWRRTRFALFAVAALASGVFAATPPAHAEPLETETLLLWEGPEKQPSGDTNFRVSVANTGDDSEPARPPVCPNSVKNEDCPANTLVKVAIDSDLEVSHPLRGDDPADPAASITAPFLVRLGTVPHYFITRYAGTGSDEDDFGASRDDLGFAIPTITATPEPSSVGQVVTYTFSLATRATAPRQPFGTVGFVDNDGHDSGSDGRPLDSNRIAEWQVAQRRADSVVVAFFSPREIYLPVAAQYSHTVAAGTGPQPTTAPAVTATTAPRRTTTTLGRARAALSPIGTTSTTVAGTPVDTTTTVTFGVFPTTPPPSNLSAAGEEDGDGPPIVVVISTLGALGVLGAIAAIRRSRRSSVDWF